MKSISASIITIAGALVLLGGTRMGNASGADAIMIFGGTVMVFAMTIWVTCLKHE